MAKQTITITRTVTRTKANTSKGPSPRVNSGSKSNKGNPNRCPSCGRFMNKP